MPLADEDERAINEALQAWRQGDLSLDAGLEFLHLADLSCPHSPASHQVAEVLANDGEAIEAGATPVLDEVRGMVILSQTCDVVRGCRDRPFLEVAPLVEMPEVQVEAIRRLKRPAFAYVPATADARLVADLDRVMTVEKALVAGWTRTPGWETDDELRAFALALARKRSRFAFPDDFVAASQALQRHLVDKHDKQTDEGAHLRALREIRVRAAPSWDDDQVQLSWWFVKDADPEEVDVDWPRFLGPWLGLFDQTGRFRLDPPVACRLEDMTARDYVESDRLDLDHLSVPRQT
jgi:hypothetical protein